MASIAKAEMPPPSRASQWNTILPCNFLRSLRTTAARLSQHAVQPIEVVHHAPVSAGFFHLALPLLEPRHVLPRVIVVLAQLDDVQRHHVEALATHLHVAQVT